MRVQQQSAAGQREVSMFDWQKLVRDNIRSLTPYSSAREEHSGGRIFLDANENSFGSAGSVAFNRYPDPLQQELKQRIAALKGVQPEQIFLGNGSDEAIDLLLRTLCEPHRDEAIICPPTYGMYSVCAAINAVPVATAPLAENFALQPEAVRRATGEHSKLLFLCSPNNPTGTVLARSAVREVLESFPGVVVIDEAYIDFCPQESWLPRLSEWPNLVILQTFSKAWGLAGLRLGMAFAAPQIISTLNAIKFPYNINSLTLQHAGKAVQQEDRMRAMVAEILAQRNWLQQTLAALPAVEEIIPSQANFLLVRFRDAGATYQRLAEAGILVRDRTREPGCAGCLRITVGTAEENRALIRVLTE